MVRWLFFNCVFLKFFICFFNKLMQYQLPLFDTPIRSNHIVSKNILSNNSNLFVHIYIVYVFSTNTNLFQYLTDCEPKQI